MRACVSRREHTASDRCLRSLDVKFAQDYAPFPLDTRGWAWRRVEEEVRSVTSMTRRPLAAADVSRVNIEVVESIATLSRQPTDLATFTSTFLITSSALAKIVNMLRQKL